MPLYSGLPVAIEEVFRLFNLDMESANSSISEKYKCPKTATHYYFSDYINDFLKKKHLELQVFITDKGQHIIGYEIKEPSDVWNKFTTTTKMISLLSQYKNKFLEEINEYSSNFKYVKIEYMEGEPEIIEFVEPFVIEW